MPAEDLDRVDALVFTRRRLRRHERLFIAGDQFRCVYAILDGFFKTSLGDSEGRDQVTGFFMGGELLGMDGMDSGRYRGSAIALEDSDVCMLPFPLLEDAARQVPSLQRRLNAVLAHEIVRGHAILMLLGSMSAEERIAAFLVNLSQRFLQRGYSGSTFVLRMSRAEIGSYLGLKLETVSRLLSALQRDGVIAVEQRHIAIVDIKRLEGRLPRH